MIAKDGGPKLINFFLFLAHLERWIGGRYDWSKHEWLWGASGKVIDYSGFSTPSPSNISEMDSFQWHCIILDPRIKYRLVFIVIGADLMD